VAAAGVIHNAISYSDEGIELWLARGLELRTQKLEQGEFLEVFTLPLAEAVEIFAIRPLVCRARSRGQDR
jgi:ADP-ribose pyrophosphatase